MDFFSALSLNSPDAHLVLKGELDAFTAVDLRHRLNGALDRGYLNFSVDATAVTFLDAGGMGAFVRLSNAVTPLGGTVAVNAASSWFWKIATLTGLGGGFGVSAIPAR